MLSFLSGVRRRWSMLRRGPEFSDALVRHLYRIYLNHDKVIHTRDGCPVYSLTTPALYSPPAAHFIARALYRTVQNRNLPNMLSLAVNDVCNAACPHCSFYDGVDEPGRRVMDAVETRAAIQAAQELGVSVINFVGGEPLLRQDLDAVIAGVDKDRSTTVLFTNGSRLADRVTSLRDAGLDSVFLSLDRADPAAHDAYRGREGLFEQGMVGLRTAREVGCSVGLSVTVTREDFADGELDRLVDLAREEGIHEVLVFDALPTGRFAEREDLVDNTDWLDDMFAWAEPLNREADPPAVAFFGFMTSHRSVGCACGASSLYISPYGDVMSCDFNHHKFGNVREEPLWRIWDRLSTDPDYRQAKWGGCKIQDSDHRRRQTVRPTHEVVVQ